TRTSSLASRNSSVGRTPRARSALSDPCKAAKKEPDRTSITTATLATARCPSASSFTTVGSNSGGRLSTTNQPRSSRTSAAVLRPAPDMPETSTSSGGRLGIGDFLSLRDVRARAAAVVRWLAIVRWSGGPVVDDLTRGGVDRGARLGALPQRLDHRLRRSGSDPGDLGDLFHGGRPQTFERAERPQERLAPGLPQTADAVERAFDHRLRPLLAVERYREAVSLVTHSLEQVQPFARTRQDDRILRPREPHLLQPLGQTRDRNIVDAQLVERAFGGGYLWRSTVDEYQARCVGELALAPGLRVDERADGGRALTGGGHSGRVRLASPAVGPLPRGDFAGL